MFGLNLFSYSSPSFVFFLFLLFFLDDRVHLFQGDAICFIYSYLSIQNELLIK